MKEWNINIRRVAVISLLALSMLLIGMTVNVRSVVYAAMPEELFIRATKYYSETEGGRIYIEHAKNAFYLFLPNEADEKRVVIRTEEPGNTVCFVLDGAEADEIDLSNVSKLGGTWTVKVIVRDLNGKIVKDFSLRIMKGSGIGTIYYTSNDPENLGRAWIEKVKGNSSSGNAMVFDANGKNLTEDAKNQVVEDFHGRGSASWTHPKKSYQLKFDKKISLINGTEKEKKWILLAQYLDPLHMNDVIAKRIASITREDYSPKATWVNFYYDGEYRGVYELSEKIEIKAGRININNLEDEYKEQDPEYGNNIDLKRDYNKYGREYQYQEGLIGPDEPGGFLIEMNGGSFDEYNGFMFKIWAGTYGANIKSPDLGNRDFVKYVSEYFQEFCDAVTALDEKGEHTGKNPNTGKYFYEYCDIDSLVDTYLALCMISNYDAFWRSQYFYKDRNGIMISGPIWDLDFALGSSAEGEIPPEHNFLTEKLIAFDLLYIKEFREKLCSRYREVYSDVMDSLINTGELLPSFRESYKTIYNSLAMDNIMWPSKFEDGVMNSAYLKGTPLKEILDYRVDWLKRHKEYLDAYFLKMAADDEDEHVYGVPVAITPRTHQRSCINHPEIVITEECTFDYYDNGDGTHKEKCNICGQERTDRHTWDGGNVISRATTAKSGMIEYACTICGATKQEEIPKVKQADITINAAAVTAASVKKVIDKVDATGGTTNAVILGKKVKKISKGAFKSTGIKTITLKTVSLKDKSVKGSLTGSTVSSVKVKVGGAGKNKKYVKQYKKIFTKKNAGRKVKVS